MEMPEPTPHHARLERFAGRWIGEEVMHPSPWGPGGKATGHIEARMELDGMALVSDYRQTRDGEVRFRGHGIYTYDPRSGLYKMYWFDSMSPDPGGPAAGRWEDERLVYEKTSERGVSRYVYDLTGEGYRFAIEMSPDGEAFTTWMEATWRRA